MFGYKIIKESEYNKLTSRITELESEVTDVKVLFSTADSEVQRLKDLNAAMRVELEEKKSKPILLTDTAEVPLVEATPKKKVVKKSSTPHRRKTVRKNETNE